MEQCVSCPAWQRTCCFQISPGNCLCWARPPLIASVLLAVLGAMCDRDCETVMLMPEPLVRRWVGEPRRRHEDASRRGCVWDRQLRPGSGPTAAGRGVHGAGPVGEDWGGGQATRGGDEHCLLHQPDRWRLAASRRGSGVHQHAPSTHPADICEGSRYGQMVPPSQGSLSIPALLWAWVGPLGLGAGTPLVPEAVLRGTLWEALSRKRKCPNVWERHSLPHLP